MINLFFIAGPLDTGIVGYIRKKTKGKNVAIIDERYELPEPDKWDVIIPICRMKEYLRPQCLLKKRFKNDMNEILMECEADQLIKLFLPHLWHAVGNVFYNKLLSKGYQVKLCNIPEGIGSLRVVQSNRVEHIREIVKNYFRKIILMLYGEKYTVFYSQKDLLGIKYFDEVYSFLPEAIEGSVKEVIPVEFPSIAVEPGNKTCVILGEWRTTDISKTVWTQYWDDMAMYCKMHYFDYELLFKPHYKDQENTFEILKKHGFTLFESQKGIEFELLAGRHIDVLVSMCSTGLVSGKIILKDNIDCIAYKSYDILKKNNPKDAEEIKRIFDLVGVTFID